MIDHGKGFREATAYLVAKRRLEAMRGPLEDLDVREDEPVDADELEEDDGAA